MAKPQAKPEVREFTVTSCAVTPGTDEDDDGNRIHRIHSLQVSTAAPTDEEDVKTVISEVIEAVEDQLGKHDGLTITFGE